MDVKNAFKRLYERQLSWQYKLFKTLGYDQGCRKVADKIVLLNIDNAAEEVFEARRHVHVRKYWNPYKRNRVMTREEQYKCAEELIDVMHFVFTSLIYLDMSYDNIEEVLNQKLAENNVREDHSNEK